MDLLKLVEAFKTSKVENSRYITLDDINVGWLGYDNDRNVIVKIGGSKDSRNVCELSENEINSLYEVLTKKIRITYRVEIYVDAIDENDAKIVFNNMADFEVQEKSEFIEIISIEME